MVSGSARLRCEGGHARAAPARAWRPTKQHLLERGELLGLAIVMRRGLPCAKLMGGLPRHGGQPGHGRLGGQRQPQRQAGRGACPRSGRGEGGGEGGSGDTGGVAGGVCKGKEQTQR